MSSCSHSQSRIGSPPLNLSALSLVSETIIRFASWIEGISREKKATGMLKSTAAFLARLSTNAVFPTDGRAASMIRSEACHPWVILSSDGNPDGTPMSPEDFCRRWISSRASFTTFPISWTSLLTLFWMAANTLVWAWSMRSSTLTDSSYEVLRISYDAVMSSLCMHFCLSILM